MTNDSFWLHERKNNSPVTVALSPWMSSDRCPLDDTAEPRWLERTRPEAQLAELRHG